MGRIVFVTGTDTGAGKTILTAMLTAFCRNRGVHARAIKPVCTGGRNDVKLLARVQAGEVDEEQINAFYFDEGLGPLVAARRAGRMIKLDETLDFIWQAAKECELLLVEGVGGVSVPIGEEFKVEDLIVALGCQVMVAAGNKLGVINHADLTVHRLRELSIEPMAVALMGLEEGGLPARTNGAILAEILAPVKVVEIPFLGLGINEIGGIEAAVEKLKKPLAELADLASI